MLTFVFRSPVPRILRAAFPDKASRMSQPKETPTPAHYKTDSSKAEKQLGINFIPLEQTIKDTALSLWEIEARVGSA